ncbi:MAG: hypothetical protein PHG05_02220 [Candidatus Nanoarchaeia archaeon]|nr:hypothetical protein [Candidatus Nanoarchaeia archaeon]
MKPEDFYKEKGGSFEAVCPITSRYVKGKTIRGNRPKTISKSRPLPETCDELFCPGNEFKQSPEILRIDGKKIKSFLMPNEMDSSWDARVFSNLYNGDLNPRITGLSNEWKNKYLETEEGKKHIRDLKSKLNPIPNDNYFFDLSCVVITSRYCPYETGNSNSEYLRLELLAALETRKIAHEEGFRYGSIFKNNGAMGGQTQPHSHSQLFNYKQSSELGNLDKHKKIFGKYPEVLMNVGHKLAEDCGWIVYEDKNISIFTVPWEEYPGLWAISLENKDTFDEINLNGFVAPFYDLLTKLISNGLGDFNFMLFDSFDTSYIQPHAKIVLRGTKTRGAYNILLGGENHPFTPKSLADKLK